MVDVFGTRDGGASATRSIEFERNTGAVRLPALGRSRLSANFQAVPPDTGIVHQVNLEFLARVGGHQDEVEGVTLAAFPDTVVGTDSHTTMINGLGVLGWGVGGIEAEAAMLGQPITRC